MRIKRFVLRSAALFSLATTSAFAGNNVTVHVGQDSQGQPALSFNPATATITAGGSITFTSDGSGFHNVDSTGGPTTFRCSVNCSSNSDPTGSAWTQVVNFPTAGTVTYQCDQHAASGMTGTINVQPLPVRLQSFDIK
jgi:plastocyanin